MIRRHLIARDAAQAPAFRWRGTEVSRLEGFSDAVFAFAVTLLVVSLEVPHSFTELLNVMRGFGAFAISFVMLIWVWYGHYMFFRRYGLNDLPTLLLNSALLFVVLVYVFPLKFLSTLLVSLALGGLDVANANGATIESGQLPDLMLIYSLGFATINLILGLLYRHALRRADRLALTPSEAVQTRQTLFLFMGGVLVALLSAAVSRLGPEWSFVSGLCYLLLPAVIVLGRRLAARP